MTSFREYIKENRIITDGAMGTYYDQLTGYKGLVSERANLYDEERIYQIHKAYVDAGASLIRTNTFAVNSAFMPDLGERMRTLDAAWSIAMKAAGECEHVWVAADLGPMDEDEKRSLDDIRAEYMTLCGHFLDLGARIFVFETMADLSAITQVIRWIKEKDEQVFVIVQFSCNQHGFTRSGLSVRGILEMAADVEEIDAVGFNCGVGPGHLLRLLKDQPLPEGKYITALPNAGYPSYLRGRTIYSDNVTYYVEAMEQIAALGIDILGGCCGTRPEHIKGISDMLMHGIRPPKKLMPRGRAEKVDGQSGHLQTPFMEKLMSGQKVLAVELDPPFDQDDSRLMKGIRSLKEAGVDVITLADSPLARARADSVACAVKAHYTQQMTVMPHISCRDKDVIAMRAQFLGMQLNDIRHALLVTGDPVARHERDSIKSVFNFNSIKLMQYLQVMNREVFADKPIYYGGAINQNARITEAVVDRVRRKIEAGASYFLTQPVYGQSDLEVIRQIRRETGARILVGIMPLVSRKNALFMKNEMPGICVPDEIIDAYQEGMSRDDYEAVAVKISLDLMHMFEHDCDGYYLMTPFNRVSLIKKILGEVKIDGNK